MLDVVFVGLLLLCCAFASTVGGRDGRVVSLMLIAATLASIPAGQLDQAWGSTQLPVLVIDLLLLGGLLAVSPHHPVVLAALAHRLSTPVGREPRRHDRRTEFHAARILQPVRLLEPPRPDHDDRRDHRRRAAAPGGAP